MIFCDLFAGTGIVGRHFKSKVKQVIFNDLELYSYIVNRNYICNSTDLGYEAEERIAYLNNVSPIHGFISEEYSEGGSGGRLYFSNENGSKIDAIRTAIDDWWSNRDISEDMYFFLLCSLLESADKVANTASVYASFLKELKKTARKPLTLEPSIFLTDNKRHYGYQEDAECLIKRIEGDILYLDPPYNERQYGAYYHLLNTIAEYKPFKPKGVTGQREYNRSSWCSKNNAIQSFENIIRDAKFKYIFLSYNNEGIIPDELIKKICGRYGRYNVLSTEYNRFKADKDTNRIYKTDKTTEYIHIIEK